MSDQAHQKTEGAASTHDNPTKQPLSFEAQHLVTIKVKCKIFKVQKAVLVKDSPYFDRALNGPFLEGQTQTIDLEDDVDDEEFAVYVESAYSSYFDQSFKLYEDAIGRRHGPGCRYVEQLRIVLHLWVLADRFLNNRLQAVAMNGMARLLDRNYRQSKFTPNHWDTGLITSLQEVFNECPIHGSLIKDKLAGVAAKMPPQRFSELHDTLDPEFRSAVTKKFIKRFENTQDQTDRC